MSVTTVTRFHATAGQEATLFELQIEGRRRMLAADGCESFDILRDQADPRSSAFIQPWSSREAHDAAFGELIMASGHLESSSVERPQPGTSALLIHDLRSRSRC